MKIYKIRLTPCPAAEALLRTCSHIGFRVKEGGVVVHAFAPRNGRAKCPEGREGCRSYGGCIYLESGDCVLLRLLERCHLISFRAFRDEIVVVAATTNRRPPVPRRGRGPCVRSIEEITVDDASFTEDEVIIARRILNAGLLSYRRRLTLSELSRELGVPKSRLSYRLRRILRKALSLQV